MTTKRKFHSIKWTPFKTINRTVVSAELNCALHSSCQRMQNPLCTRDPITPKSKQSPRPCACPATSLISVMVRSSKQSAKRSKTQRASTNINGFVPCPSVSLVKEDWIPLRRSNPALMTSTFSALSKVSYYNLSVNKTQLSFSSEHNFERHCEMRCMDDRKRLGHAIMKNKTQKRANIDCRCKKGKCRWTSHGKPNLTLSGKTSPFIESFVLTMLQLQRSNARQKESWNLFPSQLIARSRSQRAPWSHPKLSSSTHGPAGIASAFAPITSSASSASLTLTIRNGYHFLDF